MRGKVVESFIINGSHIPSYASFALYYPSIMENKLRSDCCKARMLTIGKGVSSWYECIACGSPCDVFIEQDLKPRGMAA